MLKTDCRWIVREIKRVPRRYERDRTRTCVRCASDITGTVRFDKQQSLFRAPQEPISAGSYMWSRNLCGRTQELRHND